MYKNEKAHVALIFGGKGHEHDISVLSAKYIFSLIDISRYKPLPVYITRDGKWLLVSENFFTEGYTGGTRIFPSDLHGGGFITIDGKFIKTHAAIPALHGDFGEDGTVQGALECAGILYVGCDAACGALISDKAYTKDIARALGIPTARHTVSKTHESAREFAQRTQESLSYPVFVKPARLGSSIGAARANSYEELVFAIESARSLSSRVLIEEYVDTLCELECAYLCAGGKRVISELGKIEYDTGFYDYDTKYHTDNARVSERALVSDELSGRIKHFTSELADYLSIRHLSRFDFLLAKDGRLVFNEINTFPGFTQSSLYPRLIANAGITPEELVSLLIEDTLA